MIQGNTWHEYSNELKRFLCDVAKSRWAWYLFYPLGVFVAIMYMTSQAVTVFNTFPFSEIKNNGLL